MLLRDLPNGSLAVIEPNQRFAGEIFYKNVAGIHSISKDRYWPSEYMAKNADHGPTLLQVRPLKVVALLTDLSGNKT